MTQRYTPKRRPGLSRIVARVLAARGAEVLVVPGSDGQDRRPSPITSFPAFVAMAIERGLRKGLNVDHPDWRVSYNPAVRAKTSADP